MSVSDDPPPFYEQLAHSYNQLQKDAVPPVSTKRKAPVLSSPEGGRSPTSSERTLAGQSNNDLSTAAQHGTSDGMDIDNPTDSLVGQSGGPSGNNASLITEQISPKRPHVKKARINPPVAEEDMVI
jgi:hypothetical protein